MISAQQETEGSGREIALLTAVLNGSLSVLDLGVAGEQAGGQSFGVGAAGHWMGLFAEHRQRPEWFWDGIPEGAQQAPVCLDQC